MPTNPSFEGGHSNGPTGMIPDGYEVYYTEGEVIEDAPTMKPETKVVSSSDIPPHEHELYIVDGDKCFQLFKGHAPVHAVLKAQNLDLEPRATYEASVHIYPDIVSGYAGDNKIPPERGSYSAMTRLLVGPDREWPASSWRALDWYSEGEVWPFYLEPLELVWGFEAREGENSVAIELLAKWGHAVNGFFLDAFQVKRVGEPELIDGYGKFWAARETGSFFAPHMILDNGTVDGIREMAERGAPPPVVKLVDDMGNYDLVCEASPDSLVMVRFAHPLEGCQNVEKPEVDLHEMAERILNESISRSSVGFLRKVDLLEVVNEPNPPGPDGYRRLGELMIILMDLADELGITIAFPGFNAGTPEWDQMVDFVNTGVARRAIQGGHVLTFHEGMIWDDRPMDYLYGDKIPGAEDVELPFGAMAFRLAFLYRLLEKRGEERIPAIISEFYATAYDGPAERVVDRFAWYDRVASELPYVVAVQPFTFGGANAGWERQDYQFALPELVDYAVSAKDRKNATFSEPVEGYDRYVLVVDYGFVQDPEARRQVYLEGARRGIYTGPSWQEARNKPSDAKSNTVEAVGVPPEHREAHRAYIHEVDPSAVVIFREIEEDVPWDIDITDDLPRRYDLAKWPDGRWAQRDLGIVTHVTNHHLGALMGDLHAHAAAYLNKEGGRPAYPYTFVIQRDGTIVKCLHLDEGNWHDHSGQSHKHLCIGLNGALHKYPPTEAQYLSLVKMNAWAIRNTEMSILGRDYITGHEDWFSTECPGWSQWASGHWKEEFFRRLDEEMGAPTPPSDVLVGMHDEPGGMWMADNDLEGCCLVLAQVQETPQRFDFSHLSGQVVIARVSWGYADGSGSLPRPEKATAWVNAVIETINTTRGVDGWIIGNEDNNPAEWPGGYPHPSHVVSPEYYIELYNQIAAGVSAPLAPTALDPYNVVAREFGQPADPKTWAERIYAGVYRYDFIALHAKTQTNGPDECWSSAKFTDAPLTGRYLHLKTLEDQMAWVPEKRAVYVTELNPQLRSDGSMGWEADNAEWVKQAMGYVRTQDIQGVAFYRYELAGGGQEGFALCNKPSILAAIRREV